MKIVISGYSIEDILIFLALMTPGFANCNDSLPLDLSEIIILILFSITVLKSIKLKYITIPKSLIMLFFYIIIITFILNKNGYESLKTIGIWVIYTYTIYTYVYKKMNLDIVIKLLYNLSFIVALIGIIQEIGFEIKMEGMYNFSWIGINNAITSTGGLLRVTSVFTEPAHLSIIMIPAICLFIINYFNNYKMNFNNKFKNIIILICSFFTFSMIVYLSITIVVIYFVFTEGNNSGKKIIMIFLSILILFFIISKYNESLQLISYKIQSFFTLDELDNNNLSSFAVISNLRIAIEKIKDGYILGTGMDSHATTYFNYIDSIYAGNSIVMYLNYQDASSIYIRILSEFGIVGILIYIRFIIKMQFINIKKGLKSTNIYVANRICLICMVCYGIRIGAYVNAYYILMIVMVIVSNARVKSYGGEKND